MWWVTVLRSLLVLMWQTLFRTGSYFREYTEDPGGNRVWHPITFAIYVDLVCVIIRFDYLSPWTLCMKSLVCQLVFLCGGTALFRYSLWQSDPLTLRNLPFYRAELILLPGMPLPKCSTAIFSSGNHLSSTSSSISYVLYQYRPMKTWKRSCGNLLLV